MTAWLRGNCSMKLTLNEIAKAVGGALNGAGDTIATGYSIDSRTIGPGDLFFAIKGPRFDGHDFVPQVLAKSAAGVVVDAGNFVAGQSQGVIKVRSTLTALQDLAQAVRQRWGKPLIGVTGSAGKTTTREMIAVVLAKRFSVLKSIGNLNNDFGLPLCLLRVEPSHEIGVLEMGMSAKGEIRRLASIAEPNEGLITNVNPVHLEFFESVDAIADAKAELLEGLVEPRRGYLNNDDPRVRGMANRFKGEVVTYGIQSAADFKVDSVRDLGIDGSAFTVRHRGAAIEFVLPLLGGHNIANALAAITVGASHGVPWDDIRAAVATMKPEKMRGQIVRFQEGFVVIDDSYNSNPKALTEMIRFCGSLSDYSRKIVVAGEMLELGHEGPALHRECGREAMLAGIEFIVGVQGQANEILEGARQAGARDDQLKFVPDSGAAGELLVRTVSKGDVILVKGSRGVKLENVVNALRARFSPQA
jgi:UDP-N-acetylmuramoyl-tripeptide--D-alanyl-D-alanine ligase